jgi:hypothetical protein
MATCTAQSVGFDASPPLPLPLELATLGLDIANTVNRTTSDGTTERR